MAQNFIQPGKIIDVLESDLSHVDPGDGLVDSGQPVIVGSLVGVALISAKAATDIIPVQILGVFDLSVEAIDAAAGNAVVFGDILYIDTDFTVNKDDTNGTQFGIALGAVTASATATIPVLINGV